MIENIVSAFPKLQTRCLAFDSRTKFYLTDPGSNLQCFIIKASITTEEVDDCVEVINENDKMIFFIAVDKCLTNQKSCDCAILDNRKIVFLELKLNVTTTKQKNADDTREGGLFQISRTIILFKEELAKKGKSLDDIEVIAQVAMSPVSPRDNATYKLIRASFGEKYGYDYIDSHVVTFI